MHIILEEKETAFLPGMADSLAIFDILVEHKIMIKIDLLKNHPECIQRLGQDEFKSFPVTVMEIGL